MFNNSGGKMPNETEYGSPYHHPLKPITCTGVANSIEPDQQGDILNIQNLDWSGIKVSGPSINLNVQLPNPATYEFVTTNTARGWAPDRTYVDTQQWNEAWQLISDMKHFIDTACQHLKPGYINKWHYNALINFMEIVYKCLMLQSTDTMARAALLEII